ncbi:GDSL-type esterase/lipase family protein [Bacillus sp. NPDC077027]|uniref:GDSL-type esterase/lipase family protein n=1 Tax=Bacillus sp. NPDC077027 TaxID=3390548 RepID=UPI003D04E236
MGRSYVAIGDSLTVGVGAGLFETGFVKRYRYMLEEWTDAPVDLSIFARSGLTTDEILQLLRQQEVRRALVKADIITITGCGNDFIQSVQQYDEGTDQQVFMNASSHCQANYSSMIDEIARLKQGQKKPYTIYLLNLYNPFPKLDIAEYWLQDFNRHLQLLAKKPHVNVIDIYNVFQGNEQVYLSKDHVHPNRKGYQAMAEALFQLTKTK